MLSQWLVNELGAGSVADYITLPERYLWAKIAVAAGAPKDEAAYIGLPKQYAWSDIYNAVSGDIAQSTVVVSGAGSDVNGLYTFRGTYNNNPYYNLLGEEDNSASFAIIFEDNWRIFAEEDIEYVSTNAPNYPWLSTWDTAEGVLPLPVVTAQTPNHTDWSEKQALGHIAAAYRGDTGNPANLATYIDWPWRYQVASIITYLSVDPDALAYIQRVETADGATLESNVRLAIDNFVRGCKTDGIWDAIKSSAILAGARTLSGALQPLVGAAPTNFNFVSGDYNRKTGLVGNGSTKYLDSNRNNNTDPQDNKHLAAYMTNVGSGDYFILSSGGATVAGNSSLTRSAGGTYRGRLNVASGAIILESGAVLEAPAFVGIARTASTAQNMRVNTTTLTNAVASTAPNALNLYVYANSFDSSFRSNARLSFYSIGESLDLALLSARVTSLINAYAAEIP
jgi:hypothetical protein